jgi:uncharacterized protein
MLARPLQAFEAFTERSIVMKALHLVTAILVVVGGLNWGLWGVFQFDLVAALLGGNTAPLARLVYTLVGLSAVTQLALLYSTMVNPRLAHSVS